MAEEILRSAQPRHIGFLCIGGYSSSDVRSYCRLPHSAHIRALPLMQAAGDEYAGSVTLRPLLMPPGFRASRYSPGMTGCHTCLEVVEILFLTGVQQRRGRL